MSTSEYSEHIAGGTMRLTFFICVLGILNFITAHRVNADALSCESSAKTVMSEVQHDGPRAILNSVYASGNWEVFLRCLATGDKAWIDIATSFRGISGNATDELDSAIGEALGNQPEVVLLSARSAFSLDEICSAPDVDDPRFNSYSLSMKEIQRRELALSRVKKTELLGEIAKCQKDLEKSKADIAHFYQVKN